VSLVLATQQQDLNLQIQKDQDTRTQTHFLSFSVRMFRVYESILFCVWLFMSLIVEGSVHEYKGERFVGKGNAFVVHGGSEGIYSSASENVNEKSVRPANGDSYIR